MTSSFDLDYPAPYLPLRDPLDVHVCVLLHHPPKYVIHATNILCLSQWYIAVMRLWMQMSAACHCLILCLYTI